MSNEYVTPIRHSSFSAAANTTAGAAGGAVKTGLASAALWIGAFTLIGVAVGVTLATGGLGAAGVGSIFSGITSFLTSGVTWGALIGGGLGLALGTGTSWLPGGAGAIVGGLKGGAKASARVASETAAAQELQAQIAVARAQEASPVTNNIYANDNKYGFPVQGTAMNPAMSSVQLDGAQLGGTAVGQQRAAGL